MCWTSEILKAENSGESKIPIFKILRMYTDSNELAAYYRANPYTLGKEYEAAILPRSNSFGFEIEKGLHCYHCSCKFNNFGDGILVILPNDKGTFTYMNGVRLRYNGLQNYKPVVVRGYIPPNTRYYINEDYEIVTQALVLTDVLSLNLC